jgi:YCII-related domain
MNSYLLLMRADAADLRRSENAASWEQYLGSLRASGMFNGGSAIGPGAIYRLGQHPVDASGFLTGYLRVEAGSLEEASAFLEGNPVYEAGGTVEIRELLKD